MKIHNQNVKINDFCNSYPMEKRNLRLLSVLVAIVLMGALLMAGCTGTEEAQTATPTAAATAQPTVAAENIALKVYHAGSLAQPMEAMKTAFEAEYSNVEVQLVSGGSTKLAKEITELDAVADVYASADYSLIPSLLMPAEKADWYATFAKNGLVLCYTDKSKYVDELTADNWYEILGRDDVAWAFSDPNLDPCGYRSLMVIQLAEKEYNDDMIFDNLVASRSSITTTETDGVTTVNAQELNPEYPLSIDEKSVNLITGLVAGNLDYAWEYRSVGAQNAADGVKFIELPESIDLSSVDYTDDYATVKIDTAGGVMTGKPVVYGVTVPTNADEPESGEEFVAMLLGTTGQQIMNNAGQPPIVPAGGFGDVPAALQAFVA